MSDKTVNVAAAIVISKQSKRKTTIVIDDSVPIPNLLNGYGDVMYSERRKFYREQAVQIVDALQRSLPGGTLDQVLAELCSRKASLFGVSHDDASREHNQPNTKQIKD